MHEEENEETHLHYGRLYLFSCEKKILSISRQPRKALVLQTRTLPLYTLVFF